MLNKAKCELTRLLLKHSSSEECLSVLEIVLNTINGNIPVSKYLKRKLKKYKKILRDLVNSNINLQAKRKKLIKIFKTIKLILKNFNSAPISKQFKNECK